MSVTNIEKTVISLVKSGLCGIASEVALDTDWNKVFEVCEAQRITSLVLEGACNSSIDPPEEVYEAMNQKAVSYFFQDQKQLFEISKLQNAFSQHSIDHMLIKGSVLKCMYPKTDMRTMSDADILIRVDQKKDLFAVMGMLGYDFLKESAHEFVFQKDTVCIELHKSIVPSYNKDFYEYFGDGWRLANKDVKTPSRYELNVNDHYIYIFTHFAEHYRDGGAGVLHMVDLWLYKRVYKVDELYIQKELEKLGLIEFYNNIIHTLAIWFETEAFDDMSVFITHKIFGEGIWGSSASHDVARETRKKRVSGRWNKTDRVIELVFPRAESLQYRFPSLKKHKYLLPIYWMVRWVDALLFNRERIAQRIKSLDRTTEDNISSYQKELSYVGLDFNFKE